MDTRLFGTEEEKKADIKIREELAAKLSGNPTPKDKEEVIDLLCQYTPRRLYVLYQTSDIIQKCCQDKESTLENKETKEKKLNHLEKKLNDQLIKNKHYTDLPLPPGIIQSIDGTRVVTPFHQLMGYFMVLMSQSLMTTEPLTAKMLLDQACEEGAYHALNARIERNVEKLKKANEMKVDEVNSIAREICRDAMLMGKIYRSIGYYQGAFALLNALTSYMEVPGVKEARELYLNSLAKTPQSERSQVTIKKSEIAEIVDLMLVATMEYFYLSFFSSNSSTSIMLNNAINAGDSLISSLKEYFSNWEEGRKFFGKVLPVVFDIRTPSFFSNAEGEAGREANKFPAEFPGFTKS